MATNPLSSIFGNIEAEATKLFSGVAASVGTKAAQAAASNPTVQGALDDLQGRLDRAQTAATVAAGVAGVVVLFYFLPRFESPIPRIFRKRKK